MLKWIATSVVIVLIAISSTDAEADWLRDDLTGTDLEEGIKNYVGCVSAVQAENKSMSQILILEGVAAYIPQRMRTERNTLSVGQRSELTVAIEMLKPCREILTKIATKDIEMSRHLTTIFSIIDGIYADLLNDKSSIGAANTFLVDAANGFEFIRLMPLRSPNFSCYDDSWSTCAIVQ